MNSDSLHSLRIDLARRSQWNIGYFCSGFVFWVYAAVVGGSQPLPMARIYWLVGSMVIFPVAVALSRLLRADPFSNGNALGELVGHTHMSVITLTFPVVIAAFVYMPEALPLVMAIAYCVDFYVMTWAFGTPLFGVHAAVHACRYLDMVRLATGANGRDTRIRGAGLSQYSCIDSAITSTMDEAA
jgi:hypothetical protein